MTRNVGIISVEDINMAWPAIVGAVASGVSALGGIGSSGSSRKDRLRQWMREDTVIRRRVQDAEAAGIHPLYALGANVTSPTIGGGSVARSGVVAAGRTVARAASDYGSSKRVAEAHDQAMRESAAKSTMYEAAAGRDYIEQMKSASEIGVSAQRLNQTGFGRGDVSKLGPLYQKMYDNRKELGSLGEGEMFLVGPQVAEQLEGMGAVALGTYGTTTGRKKSSKLLSAYRWMRGEGKWATKYRRGGLKRLQLQKYQRGLR